MKGTLTLKKRPPQTAAAMPIPKAVGRTGNNKRSAKPATIIMGYRIRLRRIELGMSQDALAQALGLTFQQVQKYEKAANRVDAVRLQEIAKVLDVPITYFYTEQGGETDSHQGLVERIMAHDSYRKIKLLSAFEKLSEPMRQSLVTMVEAINRETTNVNV